MNIIKKMIQDKIKLSLVCLVTISSFSLSASAADLYLLEHEEKVCKDVDGYMIYSADGAQHMYGTGYDLEDIIEQFHLTPKLVSDVPVKSVEECP